jgi:hypothetical protein
MASERKIAANRRNARKSTGPRSEPGKKRAGQNAFRHGLTVHVTSVEFERQLEVLARRIADETEDRMTHEFAGMAAEAELELARVRQVKTTLIERIIAFGGFEPPKHFLAEVRWLIALDDYIEEGRARRLGPIRPIAVDPLATMPAEEPQRSAEAAPRILHDLDNLRRYESRAVTRRDHAIRSIAPRK